MVLLTPREFSDLCARVTHAAADLSADDQADVNDALERTYSAYLVALRENERLSRLLAAGGLYHKLQEVSRS